jgi:hypothetical protein
MNRSMISLLVVLTGSALLFGCARGRRTVEPSGAPVSESRILSLYDQLKIGMSRTDAETVVGAPLFEPLRQPSGEEEHWYIKTPERKMEMHESPWGLGGIVVTYRNDKLVEKKYNFQWVKREHRDLYEKNRNSEPTPAGDVLKAAPEE